MEYLIIIGAGLSGLTAAYYLKQKNISFKIVEAQNRIGGRIETIYGIENTPMEMGATWFSKEHQHLLSLLKEIGVEHFEQHTEGIALFETMSFEPPQQYFVPANTHSAYRIAGGTYSIIESLLKNIGLENVALNTEVTDIIDEGDKIKLIDSLNNIFYCKQLVIAMPPGLLVDKIKFAPPIEPHLIQIMQNTQTWMSGSAKFTVEYKIPFWKENGFSGSVYNQSGFATEIYDHSNKEETKFALKGFLNNSVNHYSFEERRKKVVAQLVHYFGAGASTFLSYNDKIWNDKYIQSNDESFLPPHLNNGHPIYNESYMDNKLFFTGTEISKEYGGYMEGAVIAAKSVAERIVKIIK